MKRLLLMVMVFMLSVFTVAGCGGNKQEGATTSKPAEKQDEKQIVFKPYLLRPGRSILY